ncbi:MAG: hypothetical protein WD830_05340 [Chloroflexota bacterium]
MPRPRWVWLPTLAAAITLIGCGSLTPTRTPPERTAEATEVPTPSADSSPTSSPTPSGELTLHVDGMATLNRKVDQIADPEHPNDFKDNRDFQPIGPGTRVFLTAQATRRNTIYWQVSAGSRADGKLGWIPEVAGEEAVLEPFQPDCPTEFPLTPSSLSGLGRFEALTCFADSELTLIGTVTCTRPTIEYAVSGASFVDANRSCDMGEAGDVHLYGDAVTALLEAPTPVQSFTGRFLVRGHFDDPEAQFCYSIPFGTPPSTTPNQPPHPGAVVRCRQMFIVSTVTRMD